MAIKINKNLEYYADLDPTKDSKPVSLETLCKDISKGKMTLPIFQTYIRWRLEKSVELLNFQLKGMAPVSPISVNIIEDESIAIPQISFIDRDIIDIEKVKSKFSVIDGQQRLSCNYKAYTNHEDFKCIVLDLTLAEFRVNKEQVKKNQIPVGILYNEDKKVLSDYIKCHKDLQAFEVQDLITSIRSKFFKYYYTVNYATDLTEEEQLEWFEVLNLAGSRVPANQVFLTEMLVKGVDFYKEFSDKFYNLLCDVSYEDLIIQKTTEVTLPLACLNSAYEVIKNKEHTAHFSPIPSDAKGTFMSRLHPNDLRDMFDVVLKSLERATDFIQSHALNKPDRIDYITYLTGAFSHIRDDDLSIAQEQYIIDWYENVNFACKGDNSLRRAIFDNLMKVINLK